MNSYRFGAFELRPTERTLLLDQRVLPIGARAFDLLLALVTQAGQLLSKADLLDRVWPGMVVEEANVQVQVSGLRKLLGSQAIATIPGLGYRFAMALKSPAEAVPAVLPAALPAGHADAFAAVCSGGLPVAADALVGRDDDVRAVRGWVAESRLVTLVGPGGIGKTRVAQEVARREAAGPARNVAWVDLSPLASGTHLATAIANATRVQLGEGRGSAIEVLLRVLVEREMLLVLDNCEHLVADVALLVHAILTSAPGLRLLVTTQELLKVSGERVYRLNPLTLPPPGTRPEQLHDYTAVRMLEQRARLADRRFALTPENADSVIGLLRHLDGIPLAIEMAAARLPMLGPQALDARLAEWLHLLRGAHHGVPARQHTLRATLDWSHSLLATYEQTVLRRLAVFSGSFRIDTAQRVAADDGLDQDAVLDGLAALVDKSLVQFEQFDPPRYRLLETMRMYAAERLAEHAEEAATRQRHGLALAELGSEIEERFWALGDEPWLAQYAPEYDDLQAAFDRACADVDVDVAAATGNALQRLDHLRNINGPRRRRAEALHALLPRAGSRARAWIWSGVTLHGLIALDVVSRREAARQAVTCWRELNDPMRLHYALGFYASESARAHDFEAAEAAIAELRALEDPSWPLRRRMWGASALAGVCIHRGDAAGYRAASRRELDLADQAGAARAAAWSRLKLADAALMADDIDEAIDLGRRAVEQLRALDQPSNLGLALSNLCAALLLDRQRSAAAMAANEALPLMWRNDWGYLLLDSVALLCADQGGCGAAGLLIGYVDAWYGAHDDSRQPNEARLAALAAVAIEAALGVEQFARLRRDGAQLRDDEAEALATTALAEREPPRRSV